MGGSGLKLLLDTHTLLWAIGDPDRLGQRARLAIADPTNVRLVSSATAWEIAIKHRLGRLPEAEVILSAFGRHLRTLRATELPITCEHAILAGVCRIHTGIHSTGCSRPRPCSREPWWCPTTGPSTGWEPHASGSCRRPLEHLRSLSRSSPGLRPGHLPSVDESLAF